MDILMEETNILNNATTLPIALEAVYAILTSFVLGIIISWTYIKTHKGHQYSQSFVHTLIIMGTVISIVIVVIGSNIARAFSLAGALSIIRFRSSMSDPKDIAFIFFAMAAGLACGTGFYLLGAIFVVIVCGLIFALHYFNFGGKKEMPRILKITIPENLNYEGLFDEIFTGYLANYSLVSVQTTNLGTMFELTYLINKKPGVLDKPLIDEIRTINANLKVIILMGEQTSI